MLPNLTSNPSFGASRYKLNATSSSATSAPMAPKSRSHNEYTVGWVCALPKEQTAAIAMLDQRHPDLSNPNDDNAYTLGSIGNHNVVITCLPKGKVGTNPAAAVAAQMVRSFPAIKI